MSQNNPNQVDALFTKLNDGLSPLPAELLEPLWDATTASTAAFSNQLAGKPSIPKPSLIGLSITDLKNLVWELNEPSFRAEQLHHWLYVKCVRDYEAMTNLAKGFRDKLAERFQIGCLTLQDKQVSRDGTTKYLFRLADGRTIESVLIHFDEHETYSVCISTQVGCAVDCAFCATGKLGFSRHLTAPEIVDQYLYIQHDSGEEVRNIVFMGQGEPLLNYDNTLYAIKLLNQSAEVGMRRMTLSTSGVVPKILDLARENLQLTLAISLHAPNNALRNQLIPINQKWPLEQLIPTLFDYTSSTGRRLTVEYILLSGVNDRPEHAHELGKLLQGLKCNINLIPYNSIGSEYGFSRPSRHAIDLFHHVLSTYGKKVTVRLERGADIAAACGQLANQSKAQSPLSTVDLLPGLE